MLKRYEQIIESYKKWHPALFERTVECRPSGKYSILASLDDGSKIEYYDIDNTIRDVSRFYDRNNDEDVVEETWRKEFGRKLHRLIVDKGYTQERLADALGVSRQMMTRYVRGMSTPSGYNLARLSEILDCDIRELTRFGYIDE